MYLQKPLKNKYSIGKHFRALKQLRKKDPKGTPTPMPPQLQDYYKELLDEGLVVKNLQFAMFGTRNGLKYPGLIAKQIILANTILVKVPVDSLLTTRDAFFSDVERVFIENPHYFAKRWTSDWEDRIILTFLLYEYQQGEKSRWFNLIRNLPREIDYAIFWSNDEIAFLEDENLSKHINNELKRFQKDSNELLQILKNYPQFFEASTLTKQNVIWLHTHLVTRCFGKYFQYTTMVPFAELFNHECVDVYYTMFYQPGNPHDEKEEFYDEKELTDLDMQEVESSDGSYDAEDFDEADDLVEVEKGEEWIPNPEEYGQEVIKDIRGILYHMYSFINFSDSMSLHYVTQVLRQLANTTNIESWDARKKKCEQIHNINVQYIRRVKELYRKLKRKYYTYAIAQKKKQLQEKEMEKKEDVPEKGVNYFDQDWPKDKFDEFYMLCSTKDQFEAGAQVFFCYGRLPNKLLLMRYGIALEYNKYDHMFLRIDVTDVINNNIFLRTVSKEVSIKRYIKFKVKRTKFCLELISYFRMQKWKYGDPLEKIFLIKDITQELEVLYECQSYYHSVLGTYKNSLEDNEKLLDNKLIMYHQFFGLVYKVEQQRILMDQIRMIKYAMEVLSKVRQGKKFKNILAYEKREERIRDQIIMENYWRLLEGVGVQV